MELVGAGLGLHIHLHARGTARVASKRLVMIWNWSMASWLYCGSPKESAAEFCVTCWPSTLICSLAAIGGAERRIGDVVAGDAGHHHGKLQIIAAVERNLLDLGRAHVAGDG